MNFLDYLVNAMTGGQPSAQELEMRKMAQKGLLSQQPTGTAELQGMTMTPEMILEMKRNMTPPISGQGAMADQYRQNLLRPGMTMQQNYIDPRIIEMMYYKGLLNQ